MRADRIEQDIQRAARGMYTEIEWWMAALIRLADDKIVADDPEWQMMRRMLSTLHLDSCLHQVSLEQIRDLIRHNIEGSKR